VAWAPAISLRMSGSMPMKSFTRSYIGAKAVWRFGRLPLPATRESSRPVGKIPRPDTMRAATDRLRSARRCRAPYCGRRFAAVRVT
jgi:hypothetical protein